MSYFTFPQETWDAKECDKRARLTAKDGMGTKYPFKGYIGCNDGTRGSWGKIRYNGGCIHDEKWYEGEIRNLPKVADGFEIVHVLSWGWRIKRIP